MAPLNLPYSTTLAATGGTGSYTWSVASGSTLPSWLSLNSSTGVLSGTPTANATATFAVTVTDSASPADTATSSQLTLYAGNGGTEPFSLNMTSGSWTVLSTPPGTSQPFPAQTTTTLTGTVAPLTGAITGATLSLPVQDGVCSKAAGGCTNYFMDEVNPGTATGSINSNGDITLNDSLSYTLDVTVPLTAQCLSTPINMIFQSTAPQNPSTGDVTLVAANYTIPDFTGIDGTSSGPTDSCGIAQGAPGSIGLNDGTYPYGVAGSTNNNTTLNLQGTGLPIPPPPGKITTNVLSASPASPQLTTTSVTLTDTISSGGATATAATGNVNFLANGVLDRHRAGQQRRRHFHHEQLVEPDEPADGGLLRGHQLLRQYFASGAVHDPATAIGHVELAQHGGAVVTHPEPDVGHYHQPFDESELESQLPPKLGSLIRTDFSLAMGQSLTKTVRAIGARCQRTSAAATWKCSSVVSQPHAAHHPARSRLLLALRLPSISSFHWRTTPIIMVPAQGIRGHKSLQRSTTGAARFRLRTPSRALHLTVRSTPSRRRQLALPRPLVRLR